MSITADTSPAKTISIRSAVAADADRVFALLQMPELGYAPVREAFDESYALLIDDEPASLVLVAEDTEGFVLGYALATINPLLHTNGRSAHLQELAVDGAYRASGVGTALVERLEEICRASDVRQLTVASRRSFAFYERLGYRSTADFLKRTFD